MDAISVRAAGPADAALVVELLTGSWGGTVVVAHGRRYDAASLPALLAWRGARAVGLLTYEVGADAWEIVTIDAVEPRAGVGTALLTEVAERAWAAGAERIWLITTNDNLDALRFYQRRGMRIVGVSPGAVDAARKMKPSIPLIGMHGIELHDEIILERRR